MWRLSLVAVAVLLSCTDHEKKLKDRVEAREQAKKDLEKAAEAKRKGGIPVIEPAHLEPPWDDAKYVRVGTGKPCPEGMWSLFPQAPGEGDEQKKNEAKREGYVKQLKEQTYVTNLRLSSGVTVHPYNAKKKHLAIEVEGLVECVDGLGLLSLAWGEPARPFRPPGGGGDDDEESLTPQAVWRAKPLMFKLPYPTKAAAAEFAEGAGSLLEARLVYTLGKTDTDQHVVKSSRVAPADGTAAEKDALDWGAGRLVHVQLVGVRLGTDHEKTAVLEKMYR